MPVSVAMIRNRNTAQVFLQAESASHVVGSGTATAGMRFNLGGTVDSRSGGAYTGEFTWLLSGAAGDYEIRAALSSGTTPTAGPAMGAWSNLGTTREWSLSRSIVGAVSCVLAVDIRRVSDGVVIAGPVNINLDAERL